MGCCGCSLAASTAVAVVFGLVESIFGLTWNILVIVLMSQTAPPANSTLNATALPTVDSALWSEGNETAAVEYYDDLSDLSAEERWHALFTRLRSEEAYQRRLFEIVTAALVLNSIWLITTLALAVGNAEKCRTMLKPWIVSTIVITVADIAATIYFIFRAVNSNEPLSFNTAFFANIYVFYSVMFSRGGPIIWIINIVLCVFVAQRVQQIAVNKEKRMPFNTNYNIMPYALSPPYDEFGSSSSRNSKPVRPHTPPPDYEARRKRRPSLTSEPETTTLPLSMPPSSRASLAQRPLSQSSYLYDDRVEMQHRASCAAETVLHHSYDNRGLVMEAEGWTGIPRPTLKSSHH